MSIIDRSKELLSSAKNKVGDAVNNDSINTFRDLNRLHVNTLHLKAYILISGT